MRTGEMRRSSTDAVRFRVLRFVAIRLAVAVVLVAVLVAPAASVAGRSIAPAPASRDGDVGEPSIPRRSPWVGVYENCLDAIVTVRNEGLRSSGCVIHEAGYALTENYVMSHKGQAYAVYPNGRWYALRVLAADERTRVAIGRVVSDETFARIRCGLSSTVLPGDPVAAIGDPVGTGLSMVAGNIAWLGVLYKDGITFGCPMMQVDIPANPANFGGPLLNHRGEAVGMIAYDLPSRGSRTAFVTPIDDCVAALVEKLDVEHRRGIVLGMSVEPDRHAKVTGVVEGSPAAAAGIEAGDRVLQIDDRRIEATLDFHLTLMERSAGDTLKLKLRRGDRLIGTQLTLGQPEAMEAPRVEGLSPGLHCDYYEGEWTGRPRLEELEPVKTEVVETIDATPYKGGKAYGLRFSGFLGVPVDGVYGFHDRAGEGSRMSIGERVLFDSEATGGHGRVTEFIMLKAGMHPITVEFFDSNGNGNLNIEAEGPGIARNAIPAAGLFHLPRERRVEKPGSSDDAR